MNPPNRSSVLLTITDKAFELEEQVLQELLDSLLQVASSEVALLQRLLRHALLEVSVTFLPSTQMKQINLAQRNIDRTTDVLSFPMLEAKSGRLAVPLECALLGTEEKEAGLTLSLGDILIDAKQASKQAYEYGQTFEAEVAFLFVHGLLHLCGYDHQTPAQNRTMRQWQRHILQVSKLKKEET